MPFPILWSLRITPRKKIGVGLLMVMGAVYDKSHQIWRKRQRLTIDSAFVFAILRAASLSLKTSDTTCESFSQPILTKRQHRTPLTPLTPDDYTLTGTWMT
jgi:hypothetical protein